MIAVTVAGSTGADGNYTTLKGAFDALNANTTQTGNTITVTIGLDTVETASAVLNQPSGGSWTSLAIVPSGTRSVSGSIAGPLIDLNGADNVNINGAFGGGGLTIDNSSATATASTIRFISGCHQQHRSELQHQRFGDCRHRGNDFLLHRHGQR